VVPLIPEDHPDFEVLFAERERWVRAERADPYNFGYTPPHWKLADEVLSRDGLSELMISGGNRAGKTHWAARTCTRLLVSAPNLNVLCCHTSHSSSVTVQQPAIYNWLPNELKVTRKGRVGYLNYSRKNGFTDGSFILSNGSRCDFLNYTQSDQVLEGREIDLIWCDELVPQSWVETLRFRLVTRRGIMLVTQTPLEGVAAVWRDFTAGGVVEQWMDAPLLGGREAMPGWQKGKVPRVIKGRRSGVYTVFFATQDNPYNPYDSMMQKLETAPIPTILTRAYGWATEQAGRAFPRFNATAHVIPDDKVPVGGTLYQIVDPAGARNYFCIWVRVYEDGRAVVVREFPDLGGYGEWVLPGNKPDGKAGPAQTASAGRSVGGYRRLFREIEMELPGRPAGLAEGEPEPVMVRWVDPNAGGTPALSDEGGTTLIDLFAMDGETGEDLADEPMALTPSPKLPVDARIGAVNDLLAYNSMEPISPVNQPRLYIAEGCANLAYVLAEYTGLDGLKGAGKDPADCIGMFAVSPCEHVGRGGMEMIGGGTY
jgi:phage terminase large subunit-like protein